MINVDGVFSFNQTGDIFGQALIPPVKDRSNLAFWRTNNSS